MTFHVGDLETPGPPIDKEDYNRVLSLKSHVFELCVMKVDGLSVHPSKPDHLVWTGLADQSTVVLQNNNHFHIMQVGPKEVQVELTTPVKELWMSPTAKHAFNLGGLSSYFTPSPDNHTPPAPPPLHHKHRTLCLNSSLLFSECCGL